MLSVGSTSVRRCLVGLLALCALPSVRLLAGPDLASPTPDNKGAAPVQQALDEFTPVNALTTNTTYVGAASFSEKEFRKPNPLAPNGRQTNYQSIDELQNSLDYAHRFLISGPVYLKLGASYERYDFGTTDAPIPSTLQDLNGVVALEYVVHGHTAAFLRASPGVYYSQASHISLGSVDVPIAVGSAFKVPYFKNVYGLAGVNISILAHDVVDPILGVIWIVNDNLRLMAVPPTPRLIYSLNDHLDVFIGGEVSGQAYKRADNDTYRPQFKRFSGGVVDFTEDRIGAGFTFKPLKGVEIDAGGGWDLGRTFNYYRGDGAKRFRTDGAPYANLAISAEF